MAEEHPPSPKHKEIPIVGEIADQVRDDGKSVNESYGKNKQLSP